MFNGSLGSGHNSILWYALLLFAYTLKALDFYMVLCSRFKPLRAFSCILIFLEKCSFRDYALRLCAMRMVGCLIRKLFLKRGILSIQGIRRKVSFSTTLSSYLEGKHIVRAFVDNKVDS